RGVVDYALKGVRAAEEVRERAEQRLREAERRRAEVREEQGRTQWLIAQREAAAGQGPLAVRRAQLEGELAAERRQHERLAREHAERAARAEGLRARQAADTELLPRAERLAAALEDVAGAARARVAELEAQLASDGPGGEEMTAELRACAAEEAEIQARLGRASEAVTEVEVTAQRLRDQAA